MTPRQRLATVLAPEALDALEKLVRELVTAKLAETVQNGHAAPWLSIREAAAYLGVSERTIETRDCARPVAVMPLRPAAPAPPGRAGCIRSSGRGGVVRTAPPRRSPASVESSLRTAPTEEDNMQGKRTRALDSRGRPVPTPAMAASSPVSRSRAAGRCERSRPKR
jgi:hypothetical protein